MTPTNRNPLSDRIKFCLGFPKDAISDSGYESGMARPELRMLRLLGKFRTTVMLHNMDIQAEFRGGKTLGECQNTQNLCHDIEEEYKNILDGRVVHSQFSRYYFNQKRTWNDGMPNMFYVIREINKVVASIVENEKPLADVVDAENPLLAEWAESLLYVKKNREVYLTFCQVLNYFVSNLDYYQCSYWYNWDYTLTEMDRRCDDFFDNDEILMRTLEERFSESSKIVSLKSFVSSHHSTYVVVDCENTKVEQLYTVLNATDIISSVKKVILCNSASAAVLPVWDVFADELTSRGADVYKATTDRLKENKSLVDFSVLAECMIAIYESQCDSVILASSDSDFSYMIERMTGKVDFFVLMQSSICSPLYRDFLSKKSIGNILMDEFEGGNYIYLKYMTGEVRKELLSYLDSFNVNLPEIIQNICTKTFSPVSAADMATVINMVVDSITITAEDNKLKIV